MHHPPHNFVCLALLGQVEPPRLGREYDRTRALLSIRAARVNDRKPEPENCRAGASSARTPFSSHMELPMHPLMSVVAMGLLSERKHPMLHVSPGTLTVAITVRASGTQVESKSAMRQNKTLTSPAKHGWDTRGALVQSVGKPLHPRHLSLRGVRQLAPRTLTTSSAFLS